jgi:hypothetical protein
MTRSPLFYALNRGADSDAGGAADLQTDVMRFMALISLCLVAVFALVQSIPLAPVVPETVQAEAKPTPQSIEVASKPIFESTAEPISAPIAKLDPQPVVVEASEITLTRPTPARNAAPKERVVMQRPKPAPSSKAEPVPAEIVAEAAVAEPQPSPEGFTLQFETDAALTRLVARQIVGLYAITAASSLRMNIDGEEISFWPASVPVKFHEMDQSTVPDEVLAIYRNGKEANGVKWGVTLPADMSRELNSYLADETGGSLVIASNGRINLRH